MRLRSIVTSVFGSFALISSASISNVSSDNKYGAYLFRNVALPLAGLPPSNIAIGSSLSNAYLNSFNLIDDAHAAFCDMVCTRLYQNLCERI